MRATEEKIRRRWWSTPGDLSRNGGVPRVVVVGGSLGGLTAALVLRDIGCAVDVYERSPVPLVGRGAGIVVHPATVRYLVQNGTGNLAGSTAPARWVRYLDQTGDVAHAESCRYSFTSYYTLYSELLARFDARRYHVDREVVGFDQDGDGVTVALADGRTERCDLLVCADGIHSTGRRLLLPEVEHTYAGYVAWRGAVTERDLTRETFAALESAITYYVAPHSHILAYPIPGVDGSVVPGQRFTNWVWYRNVATGPAFDDLMTDARGERYVASLPAGQAQPRHVSDLRQHAQETLPPPLSELVSKTADPFIQVVYDVEVPRMSFGRICLIGDAAFVLRPHAAVGTAKAAEDAWKLAEALMQSGGDVQLALEQWEPAQLALGRRTLARTRDAGIRAQFENSWSIGDPLPFGLYEPGDSSVPEEWIADGVAPTSRWRLKSRLLRS